MGKLEIKRCPHCNGSSELRVNYNEKTNLYFVFVKCDVCGAQSPYTSSYVDPEAHDWNTSSCKKVVEAWNLRYHER